MNRRSRAGCVDCRKAKVKCDERKPVCGTCSRRGKDCRGYSTESLPMSLKWRTAATNIDGSLSKRRRRSFSSPLGTNQRLIELDQGNQRVDFQDVAKISSAVASHTQSTILRAWSLDSPRIDDVDEIQVYREFDESQRQSLQDPISFRKRSPDNYSHMLSLPWELSFFSNPNICPEKSRGVAIYFARHPAELVISSDPSFIQEMNSHVLAALQSNVEAISDSLCAIGSVYLHNEGLKSSLELALGSKIKTLARIRRGTDAVLRDLSIEQSMSMILGVVSMEVSLPVNSTFYVVLSLYSSSTSIIIHRSHQYPLFIKQPQH